MTQSLKIVARIVSSSGRDDELEVEMKVLVEETRKEPGCVQYDLHRGTENPEIFIFVEEWESKALWEDHMSGDAIRSFNERISAGLIEIAEIMQLRQVA